MFFSNGDLLSDRNHRDTHTQTDTQTETDTLPIYLKGRVKKTDYVSFVP